MARRKSDSKEWLPSYVLGGIKLTPVSTIDKVINISLCASTL